MRRLAAALLLVAACSGGAEEQAAGPGTSTTTAEARPSPTTTALPVVEPRTSAGCPGIGPMPAAPEVTYVVRGELLASVPGETGHRCLVELDAPGVLAWGGRGDRLLAGRSTLLLADGSVRRLGDVDRVLGWSRPTGRAVLALAGADLVKRALDDSPEVVLGGEGDAVYHPAGEHVVSVVALTGRPQLLLTDNLGGDPRWLSENEHAEAIRDLGFDADGRLVFVAEHDGAHHLHRFSLDGGTFETLVAVPAEDGLGRVLASPFGPSIAAARGACGDGQLWVERDGQAVVAGPGEPVGWLPDGRLVALVRPSCGERGELFVHDLAIGGRRLLASQVDAAAVRVVLPEPPPAPPGLVGAGFA